VLKTELIIEGESEMLRLGENLASLSHSGDVFYLHGQLGAGKTTFVRGFLRGKGHEGTVKSPTYTLVEHYHPGNERVYHFDLYRLGDPSELEYMGIRDYFQNHAICLIEWAENGAGYLQQADIDIHISYLDAGSRKIHIEAVTMRGRHICQSLNDKFGLLSASNGK